jgi:hypothetical protein
MSEEQAFGLESVERSAGYIPAVVDMPREPQGEEITRTELENVAAEVSAGRDEQIREHESRPFDKSVVVTDKEGRARPPNETLTVEEASHLVTGARNQAEGIDDWNERHALAAEIDRLRGGNPSVEQLQGQQPQQQPPGYEDMSQLTPEQREQRVAQVQAYAQQSTDNLAKQLQDSPALLAAVNETVRQEQARAEQAVQQYTAAAINSANTALMGLATSYPEIQGLTAQQLPVALEVISKQNPQRAKDIIDHIGLINDSVKRGAEAAQYQRQRAAAQHQAAWSRDAAICDAQYDQWSRNQGTSPAEQRAITNEVMAEFRRQGWSDQQIAHAYNTDPAMRGFLGQVQLHQAAAYRIQQRQMANVRRTKLDRSPPHVVRPGSPVERISDSDHYLRKLEKPGQTLTAKEAAAFVTARRNARR